MPMQNWQYPNTPVAGGIQQNRPGAFQYPSVPGSIQQTYTPGRAVQQSLQRRQSGMGAGQAGGAGSSPLFDESGMPLRAPRTPQEAMEFQVQAANAARRLQEQRVSQAIGALKYGIGLSLNNSPYSLAAQASPYLRDMANANLSVQYNQPDYSGFASLLGQRQGAGGGFGGNRLPVYMFQPGMVNAPAQAGAQAPAQAGAMQFPSGFGPNAGGYQADFSGLMDTRPRSNTPPLAGAEEDF